ncbi:hypothetical protein [Rubrobacter radiotolerans]|uniref:Uncharacterized protein n=1 Tax=Rubrobacter radiotolerans TaxID=42256 RepID=A0AB35T1F7_RUBRA|nr:hypothetical protein [Rubrobacter radiotolerans]MDX5893158.1 hypothetical protein [Rubrobacter radiotolerans]
MREIEGRDADITSVVSGRLATDERFAYAGREKGERGEVGGGKISQR